MIDTSHQEILEDFDLIQVITIQKNIIKVQGHFNCRQVGFEYYYSTEKIAQEVAQELRNSKGN